MVSLFVEEFTWWRSDKVHANEAISEPYVLLVFLQVKLIYQFSQIWNKLREKMTSTNEHLRSESSLFYFGAMFLLLCYALYMIPRAARKEIKLDISIDITLRESVSPRPSYAVNNKSAFLEHVWQSRCKNYVFP